VRWIGIGRCGCRVALSRLFFFCLFLNAKVGGFLREVFDLVFEKEFLVGCDGKCEASIFYIWLPNRR